MIFCTRQKNRSLTKLSFPATFAKRSKKASNASINKQSGVTMPALEIRPAQPEDREAVLAFCQHTWEWGDYIAFVWDEWLHDKQGVLFVATFDNQPVGIAHLQM